MNLSLNSNLFYSITISVLLSVTLLSACTQVKETKEPEVKPEPVEEKAPYQPEWYSDSGFQTDSLGYSSTATAISYDSASAAATVKEQCFEYLKQGVAETMEEKRTELQEKEGNDFAGYKEFIVLLRLAESTIPEYAGITNIDVIEASNDNGSYRGFAKASMNRKQLINWLDDSFSSNQDYFNAFKKHLK